VEFKHLLEQSERTAAFALNFSDPTQEILHNLGTEERQLLWAARILHSCGLYVSHSAHHKHSYYLIRNSELVGYTETEIEVIANWVRYHQKKPPKKKHDNFVIVTKKYREVVSKLHPFLRLAVALDRWQIGTISDFKWQHRPEVREFHLRLQLLNAEDDCALELGSLDYKKPSFEDEYNLKLVATLEQTLVAV